MSGTEHAFDFLASASGKPSESVPAVCVLFGDEAFLKRLVRAKLRESLLGSDPDAPFATFDGESAQWCDVADEIATVSLFGGGKRRLVVVESADDFVSKFRAQLEKYVERPKRTGILTLEVDSWASNTRLYKAIDKLGLQVDCRLPQKSGKRVDEPRVWQWLATWAESRHKIQLDQKAAKLLFEIAGPDLGILDQDLAKLALFANAKGKVNAGMVQEIVGGWKAKTIWEIVDAAADGNAGEALRQLDRAFQSGEPPLALFGQISWSLRRLTAATRIFEQAERRGVRMPLRDALLEAGVRSWPADALQNAERQLKQLGRDRASKLLQWLLDADLAMKGSHSSPERSRFVLEQLFLRMAKS